MLVSLFILHRSDQMAAAGEGRGRRENGKGGVGDRGPNVSQSSVVATAAMEIMMKC